MRIETLKELVNHPNGSMRSWAVGQLGFLGGDEAVDALINALSDPCDDVVVQACLTLRDYLPPEAVDPLITVLNHKNPLVVSNVALLLGTLEDPTAVEPLLHLVKSPDSSIRGAAASALGSFKQDRVEKVLRQLLNVETDWYVSIEVVKALGQLRCFSALKGLVKEMYRAQDGITHEHILDALADFADAKEIYFQIESQEQAFDVLFAESERHAYALPGGKKKQKQWKSVIAIKDPLKRRRHLYGTALSELKTEINWEGPANLEFSRRLVAYDDLLYAGLRLLREFARDKIDATNPDWAEIRNILALGVFLRILLRIGELQEVEEDAIEDDRSVSKLIEALKRTGEKGAVSLIHELVRKGVEAEIELIPLLKMDKGAPSYYAAEILGRMRSIRAVPTLIKALDSDDWTLAEHASDALARIGEPTLAAVEAYLKSKAEGRIYACHTLAMIGGDRALHVLLTLLEKPRGIAKAAIIIDLIDLGDARAIEPLRKLIQSESSYEMRGEAEGALLKLCRMHDITVPELKDIEARYEESDKKLEALLESSTRGRNPLADLVDPFEAMWHEPIPKTKKVGRNAPCPCGSGKKYKNCCGSEIGKVRARVPRGALVKELADKEPHPLVFQCKDCEWEYQAIAGSALLFEESKDPKFYFEREIRCPKCRSNKYELTNSAYLVLTAELTRIVSAGSRRVKKGRELPSGTSRLQILSTGIVDGKPMLPEEGIRYYTKKLRNDPQNARYHYRLGSLLCFLNEYNRAIKTYETSLQLDPNLVDSLLTLGEIYLDRDEFERARGYLEKAKALIESGIPLLSEGVSRKEVLAGIQESLVRCQHGLEESKTR